MELIQLFGVAAALYRSGEGVMASSEYYHRQADTLLTLASATIDPELSARYRSLALEYKMLAAKGAEDPASPRLVTDNPSTPADEREAD